MRYEKNVRYSLLWWTNCRFKWKYTILLTGKSFLELSFPVFVTLQSAKDFRNFINLEPSSVTFLKGCNCCFCKEKVVVYEEMFPHQMKWMRKSGDLTFSPHRLQHLLLIDFWIAAILTGSKRLLISWLQSPSVVVNRILHTKHKNLLKMEYYAVI